MKKVRIISTFELDVPESVAEKLQDDKSYRELFLRTKCFRDIKKILKKHTAEKVK